MAGQAPGAPKFEVVACIAGRGFGIRREDMRKVLLATRGKAFMLQNLFNVDPPPRGPRRFCFRRGT